MNEPLEIFQGKFLNLEAAQLGMNYLGWNVKRDPCQMCREGLFIIQN